jgi:type 1 glutamine amidotransferase
MRLIYPILFLISSGFFLNAEKKVVFIAGKKSHGYFSHEHIAGSKLLSKYINQADVGINSIVVTDDGYPKNPSILEDADSIVVYCDGGGRHLLNSHLKEFDILMKKGIGLACIHYGVEVPKGAPGNYFLKWLGGYFETNWSVNPHWVANFSKLPNHPVANGVDQFSINDEWYYHMRFREAMSGVTPILSALPSEETLRRKDGPHSNNPHVRDAVIKRKEAQHVAWVYQRGKDYNEGRGFGFTGGHHHVNWGSDNFRKLVLNGIAWTAKLTIPKGGLKAGKVDLNDLTANQDYPSSDRWSDKKIITVLNDFKK